MYAILIHSIDQMYTNFVTPFNMLIMHSFLFQTFSYSRNKNNLWAVHHILN